MSKLIKYIGTQIRWPELATTGNQSIWNPGQQEARSDAESALLIATALFIEVTTGSSGVTSFSALTDKATANIPVDNTPLAAALATKAPSTGILKAALDAAVQTSLTKADNAAVGLTSVALGANTTLTRSAHYNRTIVVTTALNVTLTVTGTDATVGDFVSVSCTGGGTVTLAGITAQAGFKTKIESGRSIEAQCLVAGVMVAATPVGAMAAIPVASAYTLTTVDLERTLDVSAASLITIPTDATLGISANWRGSFATNQTTTGAVTFAAPNAIKGTVTPPAIDVLQILTHVGADTWKYV